MNIERKSRSSFQDCLFSQGCLIVLYSLCLQIQVFTEQLYLLCPEVFLWSGQVSLLSINIAKFCHSCIHERLFRNNFEKSKHYSMSLKEGHLCTISNLFRLYSLMTGTSRKNASFLWLLVNISKKIRPWKLENVGALLVCYLDMRGEHLKNIEA